MIGFAAVIVTMLFFAGVVVAHDKGYSAGYRAGFKACDNAYWAASARKGGGS